MSYIVWQLVMQLIYTMLITNNYTFLTCGEKKIWSNIKKSQNVMIMNVCKILFSFLRLQNSNIFDLNILYLSEKVLQTKLERLSLPDLDLTEKIGEVVLKQVKFQHFFANQLLCFQVRFLLLGQILKDTKILKQINYKVSVLIQKQKILSRCNHEQNKTLAFK